jgi:hypothetical protein
MAGETVVLLWGLFDDEMYVEFDAEKFGPYHPVSGPVPLQLARHGYRLKDMTEQFDAKAAEIRAMFSNQLEPKRTAEIRERMLAAGLPI